MSSGSARTPDSAFWVAPEAVDGDRLRLDAAESRHLLRVFRAAPGAHFEAVDGAGTLYRCVLESADQGLASGRIEARVPDAGELPFAITLLVGLPDLPQVETIVALAVPLGAARIDFVTTARSGRESLGAGRLERLERIARSALKQSRRSRMPAMVSSARLESALEALPPSRFRWLADPAGEGLPAPSGTPADWSQVTISLAVGPPGGFLVEEVTVLRDADFQRISLGPTRLTTSVAAVALLSATRNLMLTAGLGRVDKTGRPGYLQ